MYSIVIVILIVVLIIYWIYKLQFYQIEVSKNIWLEDSIADGAFKTGDCIFFKAADNYFSLVHGCYFGHIGLVYVKDGVSYLFEAQYPNGFHLLPHHNKHGIYCEPLLSRLQKYKGRKFVKFLSTPLTNKQLAIMDSWVENVKHNYVYDQNFILSAVERFIGLKQHTNHTTCSELMINTWIKLGLIPMEYFDKNLANPLFILDDDPEIKKIYGDLIEIIDHPF